MDADHVARSANQAQMVHMTPVNQIPRLCGHMQILPKAAHAVILQCKQHLSLR